MASEHVKRMGARIKERREELGMTQRQLADAVGGATDGNQVSKWERGANRPTDARLELIARALHVEPSYFHTPPPTEGTGDLMTALNSGSQLDRIEAQLHALAKHVAAMDAAALERDEEMAAQLAALRDEGSGGTGRGRRPKAS